MGVYRHRAYRVTWLVAKVVLAGLMEHCRFPQHTRRGAALHWGKVPTRLAMRR